MSEFAKEILTISLEEEMKQSYLDYAMSVIVGRALPDVRDGLKPVHRRVLFAMKELGNDFNKPYKKSARVVGDVIGKYHPHGDGPVYDTLVRMAQPFSMRYVMIDGQGNFGSVDGDAPAAMRYTEVRMAKIAHELLADIDKETVNFIPNYDGSENEPAVFPTKIPHLLINGSSGIAVGMATNIPPHNLNEAFNATLMLLDNPDVEIEDLMDVLPGPDFPTGGIINGVAGIQQAYKTGRGRVILRSKAHFEGEEAKPVIVVTEIPYTVNKAKLIERIAELVRDKKITAISGLRDESDKDGMRIVIELKRGEVAEVVLNQLYKNTALQTVFGINMVALVDGQPKLLDIKQILQAFLRHRREVVTRRTVYDLRKARERAHTLEGLTVALANIDEMIELIKASRNAQEAKEAMLARSWQAGQVVGMLERVNAEDTRPETLGLDYGMVSALEYRLSPAQAQAILELRLHRLTGLEQEKIIEEYNLLLDTIADLLEILRVPERLRQVIRDELLEIQTQYADGRKTQIDANYEDMDAEDLITPEDRILMLSADGYAKSQPLSEYRAQRRGGRGKSSTSMKEEDEVGQILVTNTHDMLLWFSNKGKIYWKKTWQVPVSSRTARGRPLVNLLPLEEDERITVVLPIKEFDDKHFVFMATAQGVVKKTPLSEYSRPRASGIIAVTLDEGDELVNVGLTDGDKTIMLFSSDGNAVHFDENHVRIVGRSARGVTGIRLNEGARVMSMQIPSTDAPLVLTATENGYGKLTPVEDYPVKGRATKGVISIKTSDRNGQVVSALVCDAAQDIILITNKGTLVRSRLSEVSIVGRNTQGVKLINLQEGELVVSIALTDAEEVLEETILDEAPQTLSADDHSIAEETTDE